MKYYIALAILLQAIFFSGCDDDEEDTGSFTMTVQGAEKNVVVKQATLTVSGGQNSSSGQSSHTLRITAMVEEDSIYIGVSNWEFQAPPDKSIFTKDYYNVFSDNEELCHQVSSNKNVCEGVLIKYMEGDKLFGSYHKDEATLILHISKCDGQKVSGTFDITLENIHDNEDTKIVAGVFTDVRYTVKNSL